VNLIGEYLVAIDNKGRLRLPTGLLKQIGEKPDGDGAYAFVINRGFERCLTLYPKSVWEQITGRLSKLNRFNDRNRMFIRSFYLGASTVETDSADRILIQKALMDYASLEDQAILVSMEDRVEIWSPSLYNALLAIDPNQFADLANDVMGGGEAGAGSTDLDDLMNALR
jgi:MraZ protein